MKRFGVKMKSSVRSTNAFTMGLEEAWGHQATTREGVNGPSRRGQGFNVSLRHSQSRRQLSAPPSPTIKMQGKKMCRQSLKLTNQGDSDA